MLEISERRAGPRIETKVRVKVIGSDFEEGVFAGNLSKNGVFLETRDPFGEKGEKLQLKMWLPNATEPLRVTGRIARVVAPNRVGEVSGVGVEFLRVESRQARLFERLVDRLVDVRGIGCRKHPRIKTQAIVELGAKSEIREAISENLSKGGLFLKTVIDGFVLGDRLQVLVLHPSTGRKFSSEAEVVHIRKGDSGIRADFVEGIGVRFKPGTRTQDMDLSAFLRSILQIKPKKKSTKKA